MARALALTLVLVATLVALPAHAAGKAPPLVDVAWLAANHQRPDVVVLDVRMDGRAAFAEAHVPGAVFADYLRAGWRARNADGTPGMLPPVPALEALIGGLGIGNDDHVIVVAQGRDALEMGSATRVYWTFKVLGHDRVSILNGGMAAYAANPAHPLEAGPSTRPPAMFRADYRPGLVATREDVSNAARDNVALVDNRPRSQYAGQRTHPLARPGTIPGARNAPQHWFTIDGGAEFRAEDALAQIFVAQEVPLDGPITCFCNTGHMASMGWFVAYALLGNEDAKLYDGSMAEWSADTSLPVELGAVE